MSTIGLISLLTAFAACLVSLACLGLAHIGCQKKTSWWRSAEWAGRVAVLANAAALTFCCALIVFCLLTGDNTIQYVAQNRSNAEGALGVLYKVSGLWAGRQGSLLFWAWLISVFSSVVVLRTGKSPRPLDDGAIVIMQLVLLAFTGVLLFSESNMPFIFTDPQYLDEHGHLIGSASMWGMNTLLEHWAMAVHPPTLFIGYAGLTVPFAYAIAALIVNDDSAEWVVSSTPYAMFSWLLLGVGIGLGSVWAYVVLGWGGYWGWDPVENASLLPWLVGVALIHSFTIYRKRGAFKRWSVMCACLAFSFVILGTFITRSGLVQSVHAFEGDPVSLVLFLGLILCSLAAGAIGLLIRRDSFGAVVDGGDDVESMTSRDAAYYVNNLVMVVFAFLLAYMTISSALPSFLPFGGEALTAGTYNAIARPLGIVYLALLAVCPLLSWGKTEGADFQRRAKVPGLCALVLFALLMAYFVTYCVPTYQAIAQSGTSAALELAEYGPAWYYYLLTVLGFAVASLLFFNAGMHLVRVARKLKAAQGTRAKRALLPGLGGAVSHTAMAIILAGLIGSSMYVTEKAGYLDYDLESDSCSNSFTIKDYELVYAGNSVTLSENGDDVFYTVTLEAYKDGKHIGTVDPTVQLVQSTQQQKLVASVISLPGEDLFVVYRGVNMEGDFSLDVRVNPLISLVWLGFGLLMAGGLIALFGRRSVSAVAQAHEAQEAREEQEANEARKANAAPEALEANGAQGDAPLSFEAPVDVQVAEAAVIAAAEEAEVAENERKAEDAS